MIISQYYPLYVTFTHYNIRFHSMRLAVILFVLFKFISCFLCVDLLNTQAMGLITHISRLHWVTGIQHQAIILGKQNENNRREREWIGTRLG